MVCYQAPYLIGRTTEKALIVLSNAINQAWDKSSLIFWEDECGWWNNPWYWGGVIYFVARQGWVGDSHKDGVDIVSSICHDLRLLDFCAFQSNLERYNLNHPGTVNWQVWCDQKMLHDSKNSFVESAFTSKNMIFKYLERHYWRITGMQNIQVQDGTGAGNWKLHRGIP